MLVRFQVDACYEAETSSVVSDDELVAKTASMSLSATSDDTTTEHNPILSNGLQIVPSGEHKLVDQKNLIELATSAVKSRPRFNWIVKYPQLCLSGTPTLLLGVHQNGTFNDIEKFEIGERSRPAVRRAERSVRPGLNKLAAVLAAIHSKVFELVTENTKENLHGALLALVCKDGKLSIYERHEGTRLPDNLVQLFEAI